MRSLAAKANLIGWLVSNKHQLSRKRTHLNLQLGLCCRTLKIILKMLEITGCDGTRRNNLVLTNLVQLSMPVSPGRLPRCKNSQSDCSTVGV